ncbi:TetR/AcrR family transcriptional regulator [Polaromonas sp. SM01]|uniref:TetR/AcrR family transcriptional regulator n=1 Tax=Polaromonas sp. SM01 TaxID=3085630 RepID=UPI002980DA39|nr:TetR/AcrR family transcriptional regulator [Polaromonas sp. SM01]MDW5444239.1 TetR/AcrR family transcriptional regulator [Polaromonas sp. SM01]
MTVKLPDSPLRQRGRPRSMDAHAAILKAARQLLEDGGLPAVTMEAVAARAGVGKPTLYRWWPDRHAVAMAALMDQSDPSLPANKAQAPLQALRSQLEAVSELFSGKMGRNVATMIATADAGTELSKSFRNHFVMTRRAEGLDFLAQAVAQGHIRSDLDLDLAVDLIYGALFFRLLMGHAPLSATFVRQVLSDVLEGFATKYVEAAKPRGALKKSP